MKLRKLFIFGWLLLFSANPLLAARVHGPSDQSGPVPLGPKVKVLLEKDVPSAFLEAKGSYRVIRRDKGSVLSQGSRGKRFVVHALQDGLRWGEEYPDVYQISLIPLDESTQFYVDGIQYKGAISIYHVQDNRITVVNEVSIEDYLKSTLAIDFEESLPKEALSALAIVARTEAYKMILNHSSTTSPWDITADQAGYYGYSVTCRENGVDEAVDWSRFMVIESIKHSGLAKNIYLSVSKAEELAQQGFDAEQIIKSSFPTTKIGVTIEADDVAIR